MRSIISRMNIQQSNNCEKKHSLFGDLFGKRHVFVRAKPAKEQNLNKKDDKK